jgi:hypothetical protein
VSRCAFSYLARELQLLKSERTKKPSIEAREGVTIYRTKNTLARGEEGLDVQGETEEPWRVLCEQAVTEQDSQRLIQLVAEINRLLVEKEQRLQKMRSGTSPVKTEDPKI